MPTSTLLRSLARAPGFTAASIAALALGIGASTALFSVIDGVLLRPLPYPHAENLVSVSALTAGGDQTALSYPEFVDWREQRPPSVEAMAFTYGAGLRIRGREGATQAIVAYASEDLFPMLAVRPLLGRLPLADEQRAGSAHVLVLGFALWQGVFGGDAGVVGRTLDTDHGSFTVIGVMPATFRYPDWAECWTPLAPMLAQTPALLGRDWRADSRIIARLAPGATLARIRTALSTTALRLGAAHQEDAGLVPALVSLEENATGAIRPTLMILTGAVSLLLLIACANVATLTMVRGSMRAKEFALRAALGAGRRRIAGQVLSESAIVAAAGSTIGIGLAWATIQFLRASAPVGLPRMEEFGIDWRVVAFTATLGALTPLLFGLVPALQATRLEYSGALRGSGRGAGRGRGERRARSTFIVAQVAMSVVLLVGAGLLGRSFLKLRATSPGYDPSGLVELRIDGLESKNDTPEKLVAFYDRVRTAMLAIPGTRSVGMVYSLPPLGIGVGTTLQPSGMRYEHGREPRALYQLVDAGYFATVRQPLLRGRGFTPADMTPTSRAMVITASVASKLWPGEDPIGKPLRVIKQAPGRSDTGQPLDGEVIGVVGDVKFGSLADSATAEVYLPIPVNPWRNTFVVARVAGDQAAYIRAMRRALASVDRDIATDDINLATQLVSGMLSERRFYLQLLSAFAASALALASFGVYGVIAFGLTQRRHEIGVRTALGAQRAALLRLFIREGFAMAVIGVAIGLPLAAFSTRILASMLYGVATLDVATFGAVTLLLVLVALAASYLPARRLTRVDPAEALKAE